MNNFVYYIIVVGLLMIGSCSVLSIADNALHRQDIVNQEGN